MVSDDEYLYFVDRALDGMAATLVDLATAEKLRGILPATTDQRDCEGRCRPDDPWFGADEASWTIGWEAPARRWPLEGGG